MVEAKAVDDPLGDGHGGPDNSSDGKMAINPYHLPTTLTINVRGIPILKYTYKSFIVFDFSFLLNKFFYYLAFK